MISITVYTDKLGGGKMPEDLLKGMADRILGLLKDQKEFDHIIVNAMSKEEDFVRGIPRDMTSATTRWESEQFAKEYKKFCDEITSPTKEEDYES